MGELKEELAIKHQQINDVGLYRACDRDVCKHTQRKPVKTIWKENMSASSDDDENNRIL